MIMLPIDPNDYKVVRINSYRVLSLIHRIIDRRNASGTSTKDEAKLVRLCQQLMELVDDENQSRSN